MADTGSEPRRHVGVRLTLRLRLTLLYGAVFIAAGAGLLAVTYGLFKHSQDSSGRAVMIRGVQFSLPAGVELQGLPGAGVFRAAGVKFTGKPPKSALTGSGSDTSTTTSTPRPSPQALLSQIRSSGQNQLLRLARRANVDIREQQTGDASSLLEWSAIALGVVALLSIGLAWWLSGRALRPLRTMNSRARAISAENLHERLGIGERRDELGELASTFDGLLSRLESAFESQRRFVANASHELRTPITLERTLVEVALADPDASADSLRRVCQRVVASTEEQERLLDALLTLARSEGGLASGEPVDLAVLAEDALLEREHRLTAISIEASLEPAVVAGDPALLERLVGNLLDNAIVHNGGDAPWIRISTGEPDGVPTLRIANGGPVVAPAEVEELFEPFRRGVGERLTGDSGGLGLGLSIIRAVATAHSGAIEARALPEGGLELELRFASAAAAKPPVGGAETVTV